MRRRYAPPTDSELPEPPELPSFRVESDDVAFPDKWREPPSNRRNAFAEPSESRHIAASVSAYDRHLNTGLVRHDVSLDERSVDADAARVVRRLERSGFQAYLVGGCVRDLLLGGNPKDFDIATNARPEDVRALFRNCRIIGRRFRLAHVLFGGGKVIEVATFRRNPGAADADTTDDLLIRSDNVFGEAHEDALRRDFTVNALFYDLDRRQVLDWCGGMADIQSRTLRTVGDPGVRFREDPVRMLRAVKFASRLDLGIDPSVYDAMVYNRGELGRASRPRIFEEILRLMRMGGAHRAMWLLWEIGAMSILLPELSAFLDDDEATLGGVQRFFCKMQSVDARSRSRGAVDDVVLIAVLLHDLLSEATTGVRDMQGAINDVLDALIERLAMPRRIADAVRRITLIVPRLAFGRIGRLANTELLLPALEAAEIVLESEGRDTRHLRAIRERVSVASFTPRAAPLPEPRLPHGSRRRRVAGAH